MKSAIFLKRCWYVAAWSHEVGAKDLVARTIINQPLVLYRTEAGQIVALEDRCCHRFAPLSAGRLEGDHLRCMYHGLKFDQRGTCVEIPGQPAISPNMKVRAYPVVERHRWVWVWMGEAELADEALIPPAVGPDDPAWNMRFGQIDYEASYLLLNDNLTDFSHLSYVHPKSFGSGLEYAQTRPEVVRLLRGIRVQRWVLNPMNGEAGTAAPIPGEQWQSYDYLAPGVLLMFSAFYPPGTAERLQRREPGKDDGAVGENFTSQAVTPMTATTTRYYFAWGPRAGEGTDALADMMLGMAQVAFAEDRAIIEKQQKNINLDASRRELLTTADRGPVMMRRVIEDLINAEATGSAEPAANTDEGAASHPRQGAQ
jgi:phenylpropionate dioxygenase-like ring-hydroxylating dioxygenase large terminal subunit